MTKKQTEQSTQQNSPARSSAKVENIKATFNGLTSVIVVLSFMLMLMWVVFIASLGMMRPLIQDQYEYQAGVMKASFQKEIMIAALENKVDWNGNLGGNAQFECSYDDWQTLPYGVNLTAPLKQNLGMLPKSAHCVLKGGGNINASGQIPVALLMDGDLQNLAKGMVR